MHHETRYDLVIKEKIIAIHIFIKLAYSFSLSIQNIYMSTNLNNVYIYMSKFTIQFYIIYVYIIHYIYETYIIFIMVCKMYNKYISVHSNINNGGKYIYSHYTIVAHNDKNMYIYA